MHGQAGSPLLWAPAPMAQNKRSAPFMSMIEICMGFLAAAPSPH